MICVFVNISIRHFLLCRSNLQQLLPFLWLRWSYQPITVILLNMIKVKSRSRDARDAGEPLKPVPRQMSASKENRFLRTAQYRNHSNEIVAISHFPEQGLSLKHRDFSSSKNHRRESKQPETEHYPLKNLIQQQKQSKKHTFSKTFIGSKLRKKLQKYLLLVALVNYSLRVSYQRSEIKRYKIFVGKGNNSKLIKMIFASRFWWSITND